MINSYKKDILSEIISSFLICLPRYLTLFAVQYLYSAHTYCRVHFSEIDLEKSVLGAFIYYRLSKIKLVRQRSWWRRSAEYVHVQDHVCFVNIQLSLHENVVFSVCVCMSNAAYISYLSCGIPHPV